MAVFVHCFEFNIDFYSIHFFFFFIKWIIPKCCIYCFRVTIQRVAAIRLAWSSWIISVRVWTHASHITGDDFIWHGFDLCLMLGLLFCLLLSLSLSTLFESSAKLVGNVEICGVIFLSSVLGCNYVNQFVRSIWVCFNLLFVLTFSSMWHFLF